MPTDPTGSTGSRLQCKFTVNYANGKVLRQLLLFAFSLYPSPTPFQQGAAEQEAERCPDAVGKEVEPVAAAPASGAVCLENLYQSAHQHGA